MHDFLVEIHEFSKLMCNLSTTYIFSYCFLALSPQSYEHSDRQLDTTYMLKTNFPHFFVTLLKLSIRTASFRNVKALFLMRVSTECALFTYPQQLLIFISVFSLDSTKNKLNSLIPLFQIHIKIK